MNTKKVQTKTEMIANRLRDEILEGRFVDGQLPSKLDMSAHFQVSHRTIDAVLKRLREEGLIRGVRGTGIFVNTSVQNVSNLTPRLVLMLMPPYSIYEAEPFESLRTESLRKGLLPINLNMPSHYQRLTLQEKATLTQLLRAPIRGVLYHGRGYRSEPFLDNWRNLRSVALVLFDSENDPPGSSVLIDFRAGAYKMAQHFIRNGCRKLLVMTGYIAADVPKSETYWKRHISTQFLEGVSQAAKEAGCPMPEFHPVRKRPENSSILREEFETLAGKYDGIICTADGLAYDIIHHARKLGIRIPDDLLVSGAFNTVWSHGFDCQISSITQNPEEISRVAFQVLEDGGIHHEHVEPDIILRESTKRKE